jgi:flagellar biosynthesis/type III secretory pathway protein FliH
MSPTQGETPTPKRGPGRPRKTPETETPKKIEEVQIASGAVLAWSDYSAIFEDGHAKGKEAGYREGWNACAAKQRLPLFEAARKWAYEHATQIASFTRFLDADNAGLFAEIQAEYPDEKLIRSDRQLIFDAVKRDLKRRESLADKTVELSAGRKQEMSRTVKDFAEIVVS